MRPVVVGGLDLSLTSLGMVAVEASWDLDWRRVKHECLSYPLPEDATPREQGARLRSLALDVRRWLIWARVTHVFIEHQPGYVPANTIHSFRKNAQLHGVILLELLDEVGVEPVYVDETTGRKLLLGWVPAKNRKQHVVEALKAAGDPFRYDDERDAFTNANYGLHELGAPCLTRLLGDKPVKPKAPRKRKGNPSKSSNGSNGQVGLDGSFGKDAAE